MHSILGKNPQNDLVAPIYLMFRINRIQDNSHGAVARVPEHEGMRTLLEQLFHSVVRLGYGWISGSKILYKALCEYITISDLSAYVL